MKRRDLVRHLEAHRCQLLREGSRHSVFVNRAKGKSSTGKTAGEAITRVLSGDLDLDEI